MRKIIMSFLLLLCLVCTSACSNTSDKWYDSEMISCLGLSKKDTLETLKITRSEYTESNYGCTLTLLKPINIGEKEYTVDLVFYTDGNGNSLDQIRYTYNTNTDSAKDTFVTVKKLANTLIKEYGEPDTDIVGYSSVPMISSFDTFEDLLENSKYKECNDLWLFDPRTDGIECTLYFSFDDTEAGIIIVFDKYN